MMTFLCLIYPISLIVWGAEKPLRAFREMTGSSSRGYKGGVMPEVSGDIDTRGASTSSSETSSEMAVKTFCSLNLLPQKYFPSQL
jgi:hypothetical protein